MKTSIFRNFLRDTRGGAVFMLGLGLLPAFLVGFGALEYTEYSTLLTRTAQGQIQALYAVAKEGADYIGTDGPRQSQAWMDANLDVLGRDSASFSNSLTTASSQAKLTTVLSNIGFLGILPNVSTGLSQSFSALYHYPPMEVAFALDGSTSYRSYGDIVLSAVETGLDYLFEGQSYSDDIWVSMVFSAAFTNIGTEFVEQLVNPASVEPYYDLETLTRTGTGYMDETRAAVVQELANKTKSMLANYYSDYVDDLMQTGAPGYDVDILCVASPPLGELFYNVNLSVGDDDIEEYVNTAFEPPSKTGIYFDLVKGEAYPITAGTGAIRLPKNGALYATAAAGAYMTDSNSRNSACVGYEGITLDQVAFLNLDPEGTYYQKIVAALVEENSSYTTWGTQTGMSQNYTEPMVTVPGGCPRPAMIVGTHDADEIRERVALWGTATSSRTDESIAWGIRMLSPDYSSVWGVTDYPAEFSTDGGEREKRLIVMFDDDIATSGYGNSSWGGVDVITPMCEAALEKGIDIYMLQVGSLSSASEAIAAACVKDDDRRFEASSDMSDFDEIMAEATKRDYHIRITKAE